MSHKINLAGHIAKLKTELIRQACNKLFAHYHISYFCYLRRYQDGSFTFLPSKIDLGSYLFEDGLYPYSWFAGCPFDALKSGHMFWDIGRLMSNEQTRSLEQELTNQFKLKVGIEIIEKSETYCDFYSFSGDNPAIYSVPIQRLYQFIFYFKQEYHKLLLDASHDKLHLYNQAANLNPIPIISENANEFELGESEFAVKRYYLSGQYEGIFLTKREVEILRKMAEGNTVKSLADSLFISPRTLEHHITNIKEKLNASRAAEIVHIAKMNKIII